MKGAEGQTADFKPIYSTIDYVSQAIGLVSSNGGVLARNISQKVNSSWAKIPKIRAVCLEFVWVAEFEHYIIVGSDTGLVLVIKFMFDTTQLI